MAYQGSDDLPDEHITELRRELRSIYSELRQQRSQVERLLVDLVIMENTVLKPLAGQLREMHRQQT